MRESKFQSELKKELQKIFPGCEVWKMDPVINKQGIPDLIILFKNTWAVLEVKNSKTAKHRPNQDYYIDKLGKMSFARFIYPENKEEVIRDLQKIFNK